MTKQTLDAVAPTSDALDRYEADQPSAVSIRSLDDIRRLSLIYIKSGMFKGDRQLSDEQKMYQAGVKIIAGVEFGIQPFAAMRGINIINGNAEMSANLMAAKVKNHPKYDYRVPTWTNDNCVVELYEVPATKGQEHIKLGESSFSIEDARRAGLTSNATWAKFPRNMLFARAISNGVRIYAPDIFYGAPVYVEGEISGEFDKPPQDADEPAEAEIVDAAAPDVDQMGTPQPQSRADTKKAVQQIEAEVAGIFDDAQGNDDGEGSVMTSAQANRIYKLGRELKLDMAKLEEQVQQIKTKQEAEAAIHALEERVELARKEEGR